jgi:3-phosphoshikimate 1-carboxyvinyltransferase
MQSARSGPLSGGVGVPGDKSISHRALILAASAVGESRIGGLLESEDVLATMAAVSALGADVKRGDDGAGGNWRVYGLGVGGMAEPAGALDMGNSGTAARLLMGLVAGRDITCTFTGDASLSARPMARVMEPLGRMGASFTSREGGRLPLTVTGPASPMPIEYELPVASAQVKSAILLAGLGAPGQTVVIEPRPSRDHTERMLRHFGAEVAVEELGEGGKRITLTGQPELSGHDVIVPGDVSSAAFPLVAALIVPGSVVTLRGVGINPLRGGLIDCLREMGGRIDLANQRNLSGEPVADITVFSSPLTGIRVAGTCAPSMIDEYPILAVAAAMASGDTRMEGLAELRLKESDRLAAITRGLRACGVGVEEGDDWLTVHGLGRPAAGGAVIETNLDHRIAMAFLVLGCVTERPVTIDDAAPIETSFPGFAELMNGLGASMGASMGAAIR